MAKTNNLTDFLIDLADSIREIEGSSDAINPQDFHDRIINSQPTIYNGETELLVPAVSGVWKFNEIIDFPVNADYGVDINFVSNGTSFNSISTLVSSGLISYGRGTGEDASAIDACVESVMQNDYRIVDFGTEPQEVSEEFYEWFTSNAKIHTVYTVSGVWVFNEVLPEINEWITQYVTLISAGKEYEGIQTSYSSKNGFDMEYIKYDDGGYAYNHGGFTKEEYRTVDFGTELQEVSEEFYTWLTANAVKQ